MTDADARGSILSAPELEAIQRRRAKRYEPQIATCSRCGHQQEMPPFGMPLASSMAESIWTCQQRGGQMFVTFSYIVAGAAVQAQAKGGIAAKRLQQEALPLEVV